MSEVFEGEITNPPGRPTKHDETVVGKLETAFHNGYNISEACQYAEIDRSTYYDWLAEDDVFSYRMSVAQAAPLKAAKALVIGAIQKGDASLAFRYLERRDPDFKPKLETHKPELDESRNKLREVLHAIGQHDPSREPTAADSTDDRGVVENNPSDIS